MNAAIRPVMPSGTSESRKRPVTMLITMITASSPSTGAGSMRTTASRENASATAASSLHSDSASEPSRPTETPITTISGRSCELSPTASAMPSTTTASSAVACGRRARVLDENPAGAVATLTSPA